jgi:hypothetical protein
MGKYVRNVRENREKGEVMKPGLNILQQFYSNSDPRGDTEYYRWILLLHGFTFLLGWNVVFERRVLFLRASANLGNNF